MYLSVIEQRFAALGSGSDPLILHGARLGCGLPNRDLPLWEVRMLLYESDTEMRAKDLVCRELVLRARDCPNPWEEAAAGVMLPYLKPIAIDLASIYKVHSDVLEPCVLEGLLSFVNSTDPNRCRIFSCLCNLIYEYVRNECQNSDFLVPGGVVIAGKDAPQFPRPDYTRFASANSLITRIMSENISDFAAGNIPCRSEYSHVVETATGSRVTLRVTVSIDIEDNT